MGNVIHRNKGNPSADCNHVFRAETEEEALGQANVHAREHNVELTPEHMEIVKAHIEDE